MAAWIGYGVSVNCGEPLGCYQGTILEADGTTITLTKAFRNGFPYPKPQVTLNAADIKDLKIIEQKNDSNEKTHSTIAVTKNSKKTNRSTVSENLQNNSTSSVSSQLSHHNGPVQHRPQQSSGSSQVGNSSTNQTINIQSFGSLPKDNSMGTRSKPIDIQNRQNKQNLAGSGGILGTTPNKKDKQRKKNEACFGTPSDDPIMNEEFDFEKNLALFDKQALWEELNQAQKPDLVRQTDNARRQPPSQAKFRHYEHVLTPQPATYRAITIPDNGRGPKEYVTDEGLVVPSINPSMRRRLWAACSKAGLSAGAPELMARAGTDTALRLLGGGRRLDPRNAHQAPTVVVLVGPHREGITGVACARQLTTHGVNTVLLVSGADLQGTLRPYLNLYQLTGNKLTTNIEDLPTADLIIIALGEHGDETTSFRHLAEWTCHSRAPVLALDPPPQGTDGIVTKFSLLPILPLSHSADNGKLYLCNLSVPAKIFTDLDIQYRSPFGAKHVIALHPDDS